MSAAIAGVDLWVRWAERWRRFQQAYVPDRERQLAVIAEYVALASRGRGPRVLDLGCGPGSVADAVLLRCPAARAVAVDLDPWLLELGRRTAAAAERVEWVEADLRNPRWTRAIPSGPYDAVLSATAFHWLEPAEVWRIYGQAARLLRDDGIVLVGDILPTGSPRLQQLARAALASHEAARGETWNAFWRDARAVPEFTALVRERDRRLLPRRPVIARSIDEHAAALAEAGFREVGEVWRVHSSAVLAAMR